MTAPDPSADVRDTADDVELRALAAAATPGPWEAVAGAFGDPSGGPDHMRVVHPGWKTAHDGTVARMEYDQQGGDDAAFIAAARNALPRLLDTLDAVRALRHKRVRVRKDGERHDYVRWTDLRAALEGGAR